MKNILVPVDFSDVTQKIIEQTIKIASSLKANVRLIHVTASSLSKIKLQSEIVLPTVDGVEERFYSPVRCDIIRDQIASQYKNEHAQLLKLRKKLMDNKIRTLALLVEGKTVDVIIEEARSIKADMIILGSHGHGSLHKVLLGSVANGVLKKQTCPVLIVPSGKSGDSDTH